MVRIQLSPQIFVSTPVKWVAYTSYPVRTFSKLTARRAQINYFRRINRTYRLTPPSRFHKTLKYLLSGPCSTRFIVKLLLYVFPKLSIGTVDSISKKLQKRLYTHFILRLVRKPMRSAKSHSRLRPLLNNLNLTAEPFQPLLAGESPHLFRNANLHIDALKARYSKFPRTLDDFTTTLILRLYTLILDPLVAYRKSFLVFRVQHWLKKWVVFTTLYGVFYETPQIELYVQAFSNEVRPLKHVIRFKFLTSRLAVSLVDNSSHKTHFFISTGLLLKYFNHKRALKKNKSMKLLMMRFLRKLLLILKLKNIVLHSKGLPLFFETLINMLYQPIAHPFQNPLTSKTITEVKNKPRDLKISELVFTHSKPYGFMKLKKKGRVKRKVRRRVMKANWVVDEM